MPFIGTCAYVACGREIEGIGRCCVICGEADVADPGTGKGGTERVLACGRSVAGGWWKYPVGYVPHPLVTVGSPSSTTFAVGDGVATLA